MYGIGIVAVSGEHGPDADPVATEPLYVLGVAPGSPADRQGIRAGDVITTVNGSAPYVAGVLSPGVLNLLNQHYPQADEVRLTLRRPADGRVRTVALRPVIHPATPPEVASKLIGDVGYVSLPGFMGGAADRVLTAIADLRAKNPRMRGVVLDLRDNGGGSPDEVNRLLAAFVHGKTTAYLCDVKGACVESRTDDSVALVNLKLVTPGAAPPGPRPRTDRQGGRPARPLRPADREGPVHRPGPGSGQGRRPGLRPRERSRSPRRPGAF
jgi:carboxyl-terminal processing protease